MKKDYIKIHRRDYEKLKHEIIANAKINAPSSEEVIENIFTHFEKWVLKE